MTDVGQICQPIPSPEADDESVARLTIIRNAGLFVDDPEAIPGRHHPVPAGIRPVRLLQDYDTSRTTGRKVRCSACPHQQWHYRGFVAEMSDGRPALIGINCGEKHFGEGEWGRMHADLRREQDDAYYSARVAPALNQIRASYDRAVALKGAVKSFEADWRRMKATFPDMFKLLDTACGRSDGRLERHVRKMVPTIGRDGRPAEREQIDTITFGKVPEPYAFNARPLPYDIDAAFATLRTAKLKLEQEADTRSRREAFAELAKGRRIVADVAAQVRGYARNADLGWWSHAVRFSLAEGAIKHLSLLHRTLNGSDGWRNDNCTIPHLDLAVLASAQQLVDTWPSGA